MIVTPIRTKKVVLGDKLEDILLQSLPTLSEGSVVVITSKIVAITQGRVAPLTTNKEDLIRKEADRIFINKKTDPAWKLLLTMKDNIILPWAGIDESNSNGMYVLWPKNPLQTAEKVWQYLKKEYGLKNVGVVIIDSTFIPLRNGSVSIGLAWCGFQPVKNYIGKTDVFGKSLQYTQTNLVDGIALSAGFVMGEGSEQQPMAIITDIPGIEFVEREPTKEEIDSMHYPLEKDTFGPLIEAVKWEKGQNK